MGEVNGYTAERMKAIEDMTVVNGEIRPSDNHLILVRFNESEIDAGPLGNNPLRDTLANLTANNPVVAAGRMVIATDSVLGLFGIGDGVTTWANLPKFSRNRAPFCTVSRNAAQVVGSGGAGTVLAFDTEGSDEWGMHAAGVFTVPAGWGGRWRLTPFVKYATGTTGLREIWHRQNGVDATYSMERSNAASTAPSYNHGVSDLIMVPGNTCSVIVNHSQGANINVTGYCTFSYEGPS